MTDPTTTPGAAVAIAAAPAGHLTERMRYAQALAAADLLPSQYRSKPANVLLAMEYGLALGLDTITAIQQVHIIEGRPSASAQLLAALVRRAGHRLRVTGDDRHAIAEIIRHDDPEFTFTAEWTIERATTANLAGRDQWKKYPAAMLKARAITEVARDACPEVLSGVTGTAGDPEHDEPTTWQQPDGPTVVPSTGEIIEDAEFDDDEPPVPTADLDERAHPEQLKRIGDLFDECAEDDPVRRRAVVQAIVNRVIDSPSDLTAAEATDVALALAAAAAASGPQSALQAILDRDPEEPLPPAA